MSFICDHAYLSIIDSHYYRTWSEIAQFLLSEKTVWLHGISQPESRSRSYNLVCVVGVCGWVIKNIYSSFPARESESNGKIYLSHIFSPKLRWEIFPHSRRFRYRHYIEEEYFESRIHKSLSVGLGIRSFDFRANCSFFVQK